ncbi:MAG: hypothetical protein EP332_09075 [Bacteroidetes bacterium]|nr:MAG: hypothetical protein EP332_09075 [Bacteroidota bacterium]
MLKKTGIALFTVLLLAAFAPASAYRDVPALIHLNKAEQYDSSGFNLVSSLTSLLYREISLGKVKLYDGPGKQIQISPEALTQLQSSSGTTFESCPDLFIHEFWSSNRRSTSFEIVGFSFVHKNRIDEKIAYGYVDLSDIQDLLHKSLIPSNANGTWGTSFEDALLSRNYYFHLVQFGNENFRKDPVNAVKIKQEAFNLEKQIRNKITLPQQKRFLYELTRKRYTTDIDLGNDIITGIEQVLVKNPEIYFNLGGDKLSSFPDTLLNIPRITGLLVEEIWVKEGEARISTIRIKIFTDKGSLDWANVDQFDQAGFMVHYESLFQLFARKPFDYSAQKLNDQDLQDTAGPSFIKALKQAQWSRINEYVAL